MNTSYRAGFVGILGLPNAGKSTLINTLVGEKIAIVSARPQTTRKRVQGVFTNDQAQMIFVDAPGFVGPIIKGLNRFLAHEFHEVLKDSDTLVVVLSPDEGTKDDIEGLFKIMATTKKDVIYIINKIDLDLPERLAYLRARVKSANKTALEISALWPRERVEATLLAALTPLLPESPGPLYDPDLFTLESMRDLSAEMIRERAFMFLKQELPYSLAVRILSFDDKDPSISKISAEILVAKQNHRGMVVGIGGHMIKRIGSEAREQIEKLLGKKVFLDLHVTCKPQWMKRPEMMKELGYVIQSS